MRMHNPPHPGEIIESLCLEPLGVTVTKAAKSLGIRHKTLSAILNGRASVSAEMAVRLSIDNGMPERGRLAFECAKLDPEFEKALAEDGLGQKLHGWPASGI